MRRLRVVIGLLLSWPFYLRKQETFFKALIFGLYLNCRENWDDAPVVLSLLRILALLENRFLLRLSVSLAFRFPGTNAWTISGSHPPFSPSFYGPRAVLRTAAAAIRLRDGPPGPKVRAEKLRRTERFSTTERGDQECNTREILEKNVAAQINFISEVKYLHVL